MSWVCRQHKALNIVTGGFASVFRPRPCARPPRFLKISIRMVEGHQVSLLSVRELWEQADGLVELQLTKRCVAQCHRVVRAHRKSLLGRSFAAQSPNGRFADGMQACLIAFSSPMLQAHSDISEPCTWCRRKGHWQQATGAH